MGHLDGPVPRNGSELSLRRLRHHDPTGHPRGFTGSEV